MGKDYAVRLKCPYGDEDNWLTLKNREEALDQILSMSWDFECPVHGVQREIPLEASEKGLPLGSRPQRRVPAEASEVKAGQRLSKRLPLHVPVLANGWARDESAFHEETATLLVNAGGGVVALTAKVGLGDTVILVNKATQEKQECRVAYVGPEAGGKTRVGIGFKRPAPGFWRINRQEYRIAKTLRVWVRGVDRNGNRFVQSARTIDISRSGARLEEVGWLTRPGEIIEVKRGWQRARFRVVWTGQIGTPQANQIGICCLESNRYIWGVPLPQKNRRSYELSEERRPLDREEDSATGKPASSRIAAPFMLVHSAMAANSKKRRYPRIALPKGMLVGWQAKGERIVSRVATLGLGGLFISTPEPPAVGEVVKLLLEVPGGEVRALAVVRDSQPGKGMGVEFTAMGQEDRARLHQLLKRLLH